MKTTFKTEYVLGLPKIRRAGEFRIETVGFHGRAGKDRPLYFIYREGVEKHVAVETALAKAKERVVAMIEGGI